LHVVGRVSVERRLNSFVLQIRLLGGVQVVDDGGEPVDIGPAKCQAVLAALALWPGTVVSVPRLVAMVWGDDPPRTADKTLQSYVTRLRKELGEGSIVRVGAAYRLDVDPAAVDVVRFRRLLDSGAIDAALAEWTGAPFEGLDAEGLAPSAQGLVEQWLGALESHLAQQVDVDPAVAIGRLGELVANHPFREGLCTLLMTALYRRVSRDAHPPRRGARRRAGPGAAGAGTSDPRPRRQAPAPICRRHDRHSDRNRDVRVRRRRRRHAVVGHPPTRVGGGDGPPRAARAQCGR
jgi:hypothetical protein